MSRTGKFIPGSRKKGGSKPAIGDDAGGPLRAPDGDTEATQRLKPKGKGSRFSRPVDKKRKPGVLILSIAALIMFVALGYHYLVAAPAQAQAEAYAKQVAALQKQMEERDKKLEDERKAREAAAALRAVVVVDTQPTGATVLLAGQSQQAPARFEDIKPGTYTLTIDLPGFVTHTQPLDLEGDKEIDLGVIKLSRRVGTLEMTAPDINGANYKLRGPNGLEHRGKLPDTVEKLPEGTYELIVEHRGWPQPPETIEVVGDIVNKKEVIFGYASINFTSSPEGATVRDGNRVVGTTPVTVGQLRPGTYTYTLDKPRHKMAKVEVEVAQGQAVDKQISLDKTRGLTTSGGIEMVWVPAGFYASKHEITQQQFQNIMGVNPSTFQGSTRPVENISYAEAEKFAQKLTARERAKGTIRKGAVFALPSSAQWTKLMGDATIESSATSHKRSLNGTQPVGASEPNKYGLFDVIGNVGEWTKTEFLGKKKTRTIHGGNWLSSERNFPNAGKTSGAGLRYRDRYTGIRVILLNN